MEEKDLEWNNEFHETLREITENRPRYDIKRILGDLNTKVGREVAYQQIKGYKTFIKDANNIIRI